MDKNTASMLGSVGGAVISGGLGMLDGYLTRRYNERMIDKQNAWNLAQWNRENAYNHPSAVTARMKQAGINPALAYMNGASFAPAATSPQSGASQARSFGLQMDPMLLSNMRLQEAQARELEASADEKISRIPINDQQVNVLKKQVDVMDGQIDLMRSQAGAADAAVGLSKAQQGYYAELHNETYERVRRLKDTYDEYISQTKSETTIKLETANQIVDQLEAVRRSLLMQARYYSSHAELQSSQKQLLDKEIEIYRERFKKSMEEANARIVDLKSQVHRRGVQNVMDTHDAVLKAIATMQEQQNVFIKALDAIIPL